MTQTSIKAITSKSLEMMYSIILSHWVMCSVVVKVIRLVCVALIPLDDYKLALDVLASEMLVHTFTLGVLTSGMLV